jgi:phage FluMu protein Com
MTTSNPLTKYFRKPEYYIQLPTGGIYNPEIEKTALQEIPVMPMTAMDEISLKNPDALVNAEALVNIIKSCVPSIPDPKKLCNIDAEALYLGIRYATYGKELEVSHKCSKCEETNSFSVDIEHMIDRLPKFEEKIVIELDDVKIHLRPPTVESVTRLSLIEIEQKRMIKDIVNASNKEPESIAKKYTENFLKIANFNISLVANSIGYIEMADGETVNDFDYIVEFLQNVPSTVTEKIFKGIKEFTKQAATAMDFEFTCPECGEKDKVKMEQNPVNFSVAG